MSELVYKSEVIELLKNSVSSDIEEVITTDKNIKLIESMPCAYNADAVVAELEKRERYLENAMNESHKNGHRFSEEKAMNERVAIRYAIDIVKAGGVK